VNQVYSGADEDDAVDSPPLTVARRWGRYLLYNGLLFDFGAWAYAWMTDNPIWHANSARLLAENSPSAAIQVLDLGAGPGNSALAMGERVPAARFIAFDLAQQMVEKASANRIQAGWALDRLAPVRGDALHLPLADGSVDVVTGHSFLYLLPNYKGVLQEAYRVLRPGGSLAFLEPHVGPVDWRWLIEQGSLPLLVSLTLWRFYSWLHRRFSAQRLQAALETAGFQHVQTEVTLGRFGIFGRAQKS